MSLCGLPNEILLRIAWYLPKCDTCHCRHLTYNLSSLSRCSRQLHSVLTPELARTASPTRTLLWAIWHNRPDTAALALTHGASTSDRIFETNYVSNLTYVVVHGAPLEIAIRNRLRHTDLEACALALEICQVLMTTAVRTPRIVVFSSIVDDDDADLLRACIACIGDINEWTNWGAETLLGHAETLLGHAESDGHSEVSAVLRAAGASLEGPGGFRYGGYDRTGPIQNLPLDGRPSDYRNAYPGWDHSIVGAWDEWGPVCMLPRVRAGCLCPWCPRDVTGGYSVLWKED